MKRFLMLLVTVFLCTAFTCDNEPLEGEFVSEEQAGCDIAIQNLANAAIAFSQATEATFEQLCLEYKAAIQNQIERSDDPDGTLHPFHQKIVLLTYVLLLISFAMAFPTYVIMWHSKSTLPKFLVNKSDLICLPGWYTTLISPLSLNSLR